MTGLEVLKAKGVPASLYEGKTPKEINQIARAIDPTWKAPREITAEVVHYKPKGSGKDGMFVSLNAGGRGGVFERVCDGEKLTPEGRAAAAELLTGFANAAADALERL